MVTYYLGRTTLIWLAVAAFPTFAVLRRTRPLWIAPFWALTLVVATGLYVAPFDVKVDRAFPVGVWVRTPAWGLPAGPAPRDARGVPEYWMAGTCIAPRNPPRQVLVVGLGGPRPPAH